jgi:hypothetical protein
MKETSTQARGGSAIIDVDTNDSPGIGWLRFNASPPEDERIFMARKHGWSPHLEDACHQNSPVTYRQIAMDQAGENRTSARTRPCLLLHWQLPLRSLLADADGAGWLAATRAHKKC